MTMHKIYSTKHKIHPEDAQVMAQHSDAEFVDLMVPDLNGLLRGKRVTLKALKKAYASGICLPRSLLASDITGNAVAETGLGFDDGDEDIIAYPVPKTLRVVPWKKHPMLQCLLSFEDVKEDIASVDPRMFLQKIVKKFADRGLTPIVAVELEFYLFEKELSQEGKPQLSINPNTGYRNESKQPYYLEDFNDYETFMEEVANTCLAQKLPADTFNVENAPGQFEINLKHREALSACDDAVMLKRAIKGVAANQNLLACFMAKPLVHQAGSGTHIHVSLLDDRGHNIFAGTKDKLPMALLHAIYGLRTVLRECMLLFAPHANSYRRFVSNNYVPLNNCWGFNNRTVALRIPHSDEKNMRIEHRIAGADANPYLVTAAILAGILYGLDAQGDPGAPIVGNAYEQVEHYEPFWHDAIKDFMHSQFIKKTFGKNFQHVYGQQKLKEMHNFYTEVSALEYSWYLRSV